MNREIEEFTYNFQMFKQLISRYCYFYDEVNYPDDYSTWCGVCEMKLWGDIFKNSEGELPSVVAIKHFKEQHPDVYEFERIWLHAET